MIPLTTRKYPGKPAHSDNCAAPGAAHETAAAALDLDLLAVIEKCADLPHSVKSAILTIARESET